MKMKNKSLCQSAEEGTTIMWRNGWAVSVPPACLMNSAGEKEAPWQTHMMLTSLLVYRYRKPVMVFPFGPSPVVDTQGI